MPHTLHNFTFNQWLEAAKKHTYISSRCPRMSVSYKRILHVWDRRDCSYDRKDYFSYESEGCILKINEIFWILTHALRQEGLYTGQDGHAHRTCTVVAVSHASITPSVGIGNRLTWLRERYVRTQGYATSHSCTTRDSCRQSLTTESTM